MTKKIVFTADVVHKLLGVREAQQAPAALMKIIMDQQKRNELFKEFLDVSTDVSHDWFSEYFMSVQADRKDKKQDFTPESISKLVNMLIGSNDSSEYYEVAAGTGSMMIQRWQQDRLKHKPWDYRPSMYFYHLEELGDSTLPFLIFNCAIRGMNATIVRAKISLFSNVPMDHVISVYDAKTIYEVPLILHEQHLDDIVCEKLGIKAKEADLSQWKNIVHRYMEPQNGSVTIAMV